MDYKITHTTRYTYSTPVKVCHNLVMLTPRDDPSLVCHSHRLQIRPTPSVSARRHDYFGNMVHSFSIEKSHRQLSVTSTSRVTVTPAADEPTGPATPWEKVVANIESQTDENWLDTCPFRFDSSRIERQAVFAEFARASFTPGRPAKEALLDLTHRIHGEFTYDTQATHVNTPTPTAFRKRRGVCQDFAHVQIACLRSIGIPSRYVSGYLRTLPPPGKPRLVGADQSHAWVSAYIGDGRWLSVDPTNDCLCATDHVQIAWGRDYNDVVPIRGVFLGGGEHTLDVSVDVSELSKESDPVPPTKS